MTEMNSYCRMGVMDTRVCRCWHPQGVFTLTIKAASTVARRLAAG